MSSSLKQSKHTVTQSLTVIPHCFQGHFLNHWNSWKPELGHQLRQGSAVPAQGPHRHGRPPWLRPSPHRAATCQSSELRRLFRPKRSTIPWHPEHQFDSWGVGRKQTPVHKRKHKKGRGRKKLDRTFSGKCGHDISYMRFWILFLGQRVRFFQWNSDFFHSKCIMSWLHLYHITICCLNTAVLPNKAF